MKLMYDSLILSHLQFGITWGFECNRSFKFRKRALRIVTNSTYNADTEPLFKELNLLKLDGIFNIQCMNLFYKFTNNALPKYFQSLFRYNHEMYEIETRNHTGCTFFRRICMVLKMFWGITYRNLSINFRVILKTEFALIACMHLLATWKYT